MIKVSIVIPVFNNLKYTKQCIESVYSIGSEYPFEIIVVNNASTDKTNEYLKSIKRNLLAITNKKNLGFAKACNQGAEKAKGEYIIFLNNDTKPTENWIDHIIECFKEDKKVSIVGSKLIFDDNSVQHAGIVFDSGKLPYHIYYGVSKDDPCVNKRRYFQSVTGACLTIKKKIFEELKGFDDTFTNGLEDVDLCLRAKQLGHEILYCPKSTVYHYEGMTGGRDKYVTKNRKIFLKKWGTKIVSDEMDYFNQDLSLDGQRIIKHMFMQKNIRLNALNIIVKELNDELEEVNKKIEIIKSSKFWKLRTFYIGLKSKLLLWKNNEK